ncbi:MAG: ABC transporter permease [Parachlamydiaceae bacterium]
MTLTFVLVKSIPGDPFQQEQALPENIYQALRSHYGLNDPLAIQYVRYLGQLAQLNFGPGVMEIILEGFPTSALLGGAALAIAIPIGVCLGILASVHQRRWQDTLIIILSSLGMSVPSFVAATILQYILGIKLGLLPIAQWGSLSHLIMPALSLAALPTAFIARMTRVKMIEEFKQGYVIAARAKGMRESTIIFRHVLRNTLIPLLSYLGPLTASVFTGSFIIEKIYGIPGLGYWFVTSIGNRDYPLIMGVTIFYCAFLLAMSFIVDTVSLVLDPRIAARQR